MDRKLLVFATWITLTYLSLLLLSTSEVWADRRYYKAMEDYYDDLEDYYDDRDPQLSKYYERMENYYEDLRKGRRARLPVHYPGVYPHEPGPHHQVYRPPHPQKIIREQQIPQLFGQVSPQPQPIHKPSTIQAGPHTELQQAYRDLYAQLARLTSRESWREYLKLPLSLEGNGTTLDSLQSVEAREEFDKALHRYERASEDASYRLIANLPAFTRTYNALLSFITWLDDQPTPADDHSFDEELPLPQAVENRGNIEGPLLRPQPR